MHASIAIAGLLVTGVSALELSTASYSFQQYCIDHGRNYAAGEEMLTRKANFDRNLAKVVAHNTDKTQLYKKGINRFSDWSEQEMRAFNTLKRVRSSKDVSVYKRTTGKATPLEALDYRNEGVLTSVKDQGHCGSCWAFSVVATVESAFALKTGEVAVLSVGQLNECDKNDGGCEGGYPETAFTWIKEQSGGLYSEWQYPYYDYFGQQDCREVGAARTTTVTNVFRVTPNSVPDIMDALATKGPLSIGVACDEALHHYSSGIFTMTKGEWQLNHAVQLVGYGSDESLNGQQYWIVRNSWSTGWGEYGFIRMWKATKGTNQTEPCNADKSECGTAGMLADLTGVEVAKP